MKKQDIELSFMVNEEQVSLLHLAMVQLIDRTAQVLKDNEDEGGEVHLDAYTKELCEERIELLEDLIEQLEEHVIDGEQQTDKGEYTE